MDDWSKVVAIVIPLVMNWLEVKGLRREMKDTHTKHDDRLSQLEKRVKALDGLNPVTE